MTDMDKLPNSGELLTEQTVKKTAEKYCLRGSKNGIRSLWKSKILGAERGRKETGRGNV